jgi:hypothetical protein
MAHKPLEKNVQDLLCQALETEIGGVAIYQMALLCAQHDALREEWQKYLEQTERHVRIVRDVFEALGLDAEATTPGRLIVREKGNCPVNLMRKALKTTRRGAGGRGRVYRRRRDQGSPELGAGRAP